VPARDPQMILGHARSPPTMQIYTHVDQEARDDGRTRLNNLVAGGE
jgi:integrase